MARARRLGVPAYRLRQVSRPTRGVRVAIPSDAWQARVAAMVAALPDDVALSHLTACRLWMLPLPHVLRDLATIDVMRDSARGFVRRAGCRGHRGLERRDVAVLRGVRVTGLADTWVDLGEVHTRGLTLDDLVVIGDAIATRLHEGRRTPEAPWEPVAAPHPDRSPGIDALRSALEARVRPRGRAVLDEAVSLVRAPVRSPMETRARLMFVRAGFPEPWPNLRIHRVDDGGFLMEGDLVWRDERVVGEYQGEDHASRARRSRDSDRAAIAREHGWRVREIFAEDVFGATRRRRLLDGFAADLGLDPASLDLA